MRRPGPRPLARALDGVVERASPQTLLARVQGGWDAVAGEVVAGEARPSTERGGTVTCTCSSAVWANELELLEPDLRGRLNEALGGTAEGPVRRLRFTAKGAPRAPADAPAAPADNAGNPGAGRAPFVRFCRYFVTRRDVRRGPYPANIRYRFTECPGSAGATRPAGASSCVW